VGAISSSITHHLLIAEICLEQVFRSWSSKELGVLEEYQEAIPSSPRTTRIEQFRSWLRGALGLDRAIAFTILARIWSSAAGLITVALIARFLSPAEQGYYYTFGSLVALQIVFELGFSFVILQMASHERAHLTISTDYVISGDPRAHARLASVLQKSVRWYSIAAVLMAALLIPAGWYFFTIHQHPGQTASWHLPWSFAALAATLTFQLDPMLSFLEGCGYVAKVARLRFAQAATGSVLAWTALVLHHGLFAPSMMILGMALAAIVWLWGRRHLLFGLLKYHPGPQRIHWRKEVWPFQWRIAISWICGYFIFQLFNPVLFAFKGPVAAGQMGMSLSLASALQSVAISWINTKAAPFGTMIARKEYFQLDKLFFQALKQSVAVCIAGAFTIWLGSVYLSWAHIRFAQRILHPTPLGILLLATTINIIIFAEALYLRAHKQEKFLFNSVLGALLTGACTYFIGREYGAMGMVMGYLGVTLIIGLPLGTYTFMKYRNIWHAD
jgi:O-antigen/teichoic acid export membrane protein